MADIALLSHVASTKSNLRATLDVEESLEQMTLVAAEAIEAGAAVLINTSGLFANADASVVGTADVYGIAVRKVAAGEAVTAVAKGVLGGFDFTAQAYSAKIFLSDTNVGRLGDAAGTVSVTIGRVIPANGVTRGSSPKKLLQVRL